MFEWTEMINIVGNISRYFGKFLGNQTLKLDFYVVVDTRPLTNRTHRYRSHNETYPH